MVTFVCLTLVVDEKKGRMSYLRISSQELASSPVWGQHSYGTVQPQENPQGKVSVK